MSTLKELSAKRMSKSVKFMGEDVKIYKLSVAEVLSIQEKSKDAGATETAGFEVLRTVIRMAVEGAKELEDGDFNNFPMDELSKISAEIMKFSGLGEPAGKSA